MERTGTCLCGSLQVVVSGEPRFVNACHCTDCQRRSGAPMTSNAYFPSSKVQLKGASRTYRRISAAGRWLDHNFCPDCGTTVCWTLEALPNEHGVPVGLFNDPTFPAPHVVAWEQSKYAWFPDVPGAEHFARGSLPPK
jgi:hypothetical protein